MKSAAPNDEEHPWRMDLALVATGDPDALGRLYDATSPLVFGLVSRIVRHPEVAEEVTLDVYHQVWRQAARYDPSRGRVSTWLLTIARSRAIDRLRSSGRGGRHESLESLATYVDESPDPASRSVMADSARRIHSAVQELPAAQRVAVTMAFFDGLTHSEIAERLGEPLGTIKTRVRTALNRLRGALAPLGGDASD